MDLDVDVHRALMWMVYASRWLKTRHMVPVGAGNVHPSGATY